MVEDDSDVDEDCVCRVIEDDGHMAEQFHPVPQLLMAFLLDNYLFWNLKKSNSTSNSESKRYIKSSVQTLNLNKNLVYLN